jgi:hypothetical protein
MAIAPNDAQRIKDFLIQRGLLTKEIAPDVVAVAAEQIVSKTVRPEAEGPGGPAQQSAGQVQPEPTQPTAQTDDAPQPAAQTDDAPQPAAQTEDAPQPDAAAVENLGWVTDQQRNLLESEIDPIRGDWRDWLPDELDLRRPAWRTEDPGELAGWLTDMIPGFAQPSEELGLASSLSDEYAQALLEDPDMAAIAASLSQDELAELIHQAASR